MPAGATFTHAVPRGHNVFAYVLDGEAYFDPERDAFAHRAVGANYFDFPPRCVCSAEHLLLYEDGDEVAVETREQSVRFLLVSGRPIGEPVAWYGPIVMNTQQELRMAFKQYRRRHVPPRPGHGQRQPLITRISLIGNGTARQEVTHEEDSPPLAVCLICVHPCNQWPTSRCRSP